MTQAQAFPNSLNQLLSGTGLFIKTGPFTVHVQSSIPGVAEGLSLLYSEYPQFDACEFADFHISLQPAAGIRRWLRPQVLFAFDGYKPFKPLPLDQAFPMFEWGLNWCVANHFHRYLIIHAAVVEKNGHAAILPAPPGSGKSTLCAGLVSRGWRLFSDELALIDVETGELVPVPRPVNLKNESIAIMKAYAPDGVFGRQVADTNKGTVCHMKAPSESIRRAEERALPAWVILPRWVAESAPQLVPASRAQTGLLLAQNSFNYHVLAEQGFNGLADVVDRCDCYTFEYSQLDDAVAVFDALAVRQ